MRTQLLHQRSIPETHIAVAQRVNPTGGIVSCSPTRLIGNTQQLEAVARGGVEEVRALDVDGLDRAGELGAEREDLDLSANKVSTKNPDTFNFNISLALCQIHESIWQDGSSNIPRW